MLPFHSITLALLSFWGARSAGRPVSFVLYYCSVQFALAFTCAVLNVGPFLLGKQKNGEMPSWSYIVCWPVHLVKAVVKSHLYKLNGRNGTNPDATEIIPGWWVGGRGAESLRIPWVGIVDCTNEFPRAVFGAHNSQYLCIPSWDATCCAPDALQQAAEFLLQASKQGPVLAHCASGKGRSVCVMAVALVHMGHCTTLEEAQELIRSKRRVSPVLRNPLMGPRMRQWMKVHRKDT